MPAPRRTQRERKAESHLRLLAAAQQVLSDKGYAGATIEEIVKAAGYSQGAFYNHWSSKDQMVMDLVKKVADYQLDHLQDQILEGSRIFASLKAKSGDPRLFFELWLMAVRGHSIAGFLKEHYQAWRNVLSELIRARQGTGSDDADQSLWQKAALLIALFDGLLIQYELDPDFFADPAFEETFERMVKKLAEE